MGRVKPNTIEGQFLAHRLDLIESVAWGGLSLAARRVLDRLEIEHMHHGGSENGRLPCTYSDFEAFGVRRKSIAGALDELVSSGLVVITHQGRGGNAIYRDANRYRLTYLHTKAQAPTDDWRRAGQHVGAVRKNKKPGAKTPPTQGAKTPPTEPFPGGENAPTGPVAKTPLHSISRGKGPSSTEAAEPPAQRAPQSAVASRGRAQPALDHPLARRAARSDARRDDTLPRSTPASAPDGTEPAPSRLGDLAAVILARATKSSPGAA